MEDFKKENTIENKEHTPSREEVLSVISSFIENSIVVEEKPNEEGLFVLHAKGKPDAKGEYSQYEYMKKGVHPGFGEAKLTSIYWSEYDADGMPFKGNDVAVYDEDSKLWYKINPDETRGDVIEVNIEKNETKENIDEPKDIENVSKKNEFVEKYKEDQVERNNLQNELTDENFKQFKPAILAEEEMMRDLQVSIENTKTLREAGPDVSEIEEMFSSFETEYSLSVLDSINEITLDEAMNHPVRKPAKEALAPILKKMEVLNRETNIDRERQEILEMKYKELTKSVGIFREGKIIHEISTEKMKYYN